MHKEMLPDRVSDLEEDPSVQEAVGYSTIVARVCRVNRVVSLEPDMPFRYLQKAQSNIL